MVDNVGCLPWDFPVPEGLGGAANFPLCTSHVGGNLNNSRYAFDTSLDDSDVLRNCTEDCMPDCTETSYDYQVDTTNLDAEELCLDENTRNVRKTI